MAFDVTGTVRHERPSPAYGFRQSVAERGPSASEILRNQRLRDLIAAIEEFWRASGPDRTYWRGHASWLIGQWRCLHQRPERAAFQAAVTQSGIFRDHRCWKCQDGAKPCAQDIPNQCEFPMARNH